MTRRRYAFLLLWIPACGSTGVNGLQVPGFSSGATSWWLKLPDLDLPGWQYDMSVSATYHPSAYYREPRQSAPLGIRVSTSGGAVHKPDLTNVSNLNQFIARQLGMAASHRPHAIEELPPIKYGDGTSHRYFLL
jgi:hypothetical protein